MQLPEFLENLCKRITDLYFFAFGDSETSTVRDITITDANNWTPIAHMSKPSILFVRNRSLTKELFITWNDKAPEGGRMPKDTVYAFDRVSGTVYAKLVDSGTNVNVNTFCVGAKG